MIQTRLESEKTEKIQTTWYCNHHKLISIKLICDTHACRSAIKPRLFGRNADPNYKQYAGISLAPRAPDKAVRDALITKSNKEIDNNPTLSNTEKAKEKMVYPTHPSNEDILHIIYCCRGLRIKFWMSSINKSMHSAEVIIMGSIVQHDSYWTLLTDIHIFRSLTGCLMLNRFVIRVGNWCSYFNWWLVAL